MANDTAEQKPLIINRTPYEIAARVAYEAIAYGEFLEEQPDILDSLKRSIFQAVRDEIIDAATAPAPVSRATV